MKKLITAQEFERAFCLQWEKDKHSLEEDINEAYNGSCWENQKDKRTKFMLGAKGEEGRKKAFFYRVLQRVLQKLEREDIDFSREWYTLDGIYHRCESIYRKDYPPCMDVLIEHENESDTMEEEMWKLLMFRSPLKVLVSYDWIEKEKITPTRMNFFEKETQQTSPHGKAS